MFYYIDDDMVFPLLITFAFLLAFIFIIGMTDKTKYGYTDLNGNKGIAEHCRQNYCEVDDKTITVKEYWKIESEDK